MYRLSCFFLLAALMFHRQVSCAWEDDSSEEEPKIARQVVDNSFRSPYRFAAYPWQQWSSPYASYQPRYQPSFRRNASYIETLNSYSRYSGVVS